MQKDHIPMLDGIRGLAAMLVVCAHLGQLGLGLSPPALCGALGVSLFFTLSGFLMAFLYLEKPADMPALVHYAAARVGRVTPLYWLVLTVSFGLSALPGHDFAYHFTPGSYLRHMVFAGSKPPFWSIPPEIQFYGVFMLLWWLTASGLLRRWWPVALLSTALLVLARSAFPGIVVFSVLHIFLLGVAAGVARRRLGAAAVSRRAALLAQVGALAMLAALLAGLGPDRAWLAGIGWHNDRSTYDSLALALLITACLFAFTFETRLARLLFANTLSRRLGAYSFSIYLLHEPVMRAATQATAQLGLGAAGQLAAGLLAMFAVSAASFAWFELPLQRVARGLVLRLLVRRAAVIDAPPSAPQNV